MKRKVCAACVVVGALVGQATDVSGQGLGTTYLDRLVEVWHEDASGADVEHLAALLSPDAVYEHPRVGARVEGRDDIVEAMGSFLGSTRRPRVSDVQVVTGADVAVVGFDLTIEQRGADGWSILKRRQVLVLTIHEDRIVRIEDHW